MAGIHSYRTDNNHTFRIITYQWYCSFTIHNSSVAIPPPPQTVIQNEKIILSICIYPTLFFLYLPAPVKETGWSIRYFNLFLRTGCCQTRSTIRGRAPCGGETQMSSRGHSSQRKVTNLNLHQGHLYALLRSGTRIQEHVERQIRILREHQ